MTLNPIESYFEFEPAPLCLSELETPLPIMNLDVVERNLHRWQERCDRLGLHNRPHIKTHKMISLARYQLALGAVGITAQKLAEAEVMASAGLSDILVTFNIVGKTKLDRLATLARSVKISVVADSPTITEGLIAAGKSAGRPIDVLVECDTGGGRNGVQSPAAAVELASQIANTPHLSCKGLMTYPAPGGRAAMAGFFREAASRMKKSGLETDCITVGGTPDMWKDEGLDAVTEYRAGTYIFNDLSVVAAGACNHGDCAVDILATVVSHPTSSRVIVDAGSKSLTCDQSAEPGFGELRGCRSRLYGISEEHGMVDVSRCSQEFKVADRVRIIPNHVCPVLNLFDRVAAVKNGCVIGFARVNARGCVT